MIGPYRPWGPLRWIDPKLHNPDWSVLGVSGTEDRCLAILQSLPQERRRRSRFLRIEDPEPQDRASYQARLTVVGEAMAVEGVGARLVDCVDLLADIDTMRDTVGAFADQAGPDVLLDITAMPKWWFFPTLRLLLADARIRNLAVTYASAPHYGKNLSSNPLPTAALPTFDTLDGRTQHEELVVGIGFAPLGLHELYTRNVKRIRYLFPFPPGPPHFQRNWMFLKELQDQIANPEERREDDRWHVHMYDCPAIFEAISRFTAAGTRTCALAPFGPKTVSLAMCLFALAAEAAHRQMVPAYYTQPKRYATNYTSGIKMADGVPDVRAYMVRLDGRDLYGLS